jgi:hypothetical protein
MLALRKTVGHPGSTPFRRCQPYLRLIAPLFFSILALVSQFSHRQICPSRPSLQKQIPVPTASTIVLVLLPHTHSRFEPDVGQDSDEERVLKKKTLQVCRIDS